MADDNPITRRRVLGGMATIGAAGAVGAGTWSRFTDEEDKQVTVSAGILDLTIDGHNGDTVEVSGGPLENGGTFQDCETLKNVGNITGDTLYIELPEDGLKDFENGIEEPEAEAGDTSGRSVNGFSTDHYGGGGHHGGGDGGHHGGNDGELSKYLSIKGSLSCTDSPCTPSSNGAQSDYVPLRDALGHRIPVSVDMGEGDTCELCFTVKLSEDYVDSDDANDAMGDSTQFDIDLTLEQNPSNDENGGGHNGGGHNGGGHNGGGHNGGGHNGGHY